MDQPKYEDIACSHDLKTFLFVSEGRHGKLTKIVKFDKLRSRKNTFNLALGTILPTGELDYTGTTNNGDRNKVLTTVAAIVYRFTERYPGNDVYLTGSDSRRNLLYQRAIAFGYNELSRTFDIYGNFSESGEEEQFEPFDRTKQYSGFLIERKYPNDVL